MKKRGLRWVGLLSAVSLMALTSHADDRRGYESASGNPSGAAVHGLEWRWGPGDSRHSARDGGLFHSPLFSSTRPWGPNEYLLIGAGVVVTVVVIVLATDHHHDDPPHP